MYITYKLIHREGFCASSSFKSSQRVCLCNNINLRELFSFPENKITRIHSQCEMAWPSSWRCEVSFVFDIIFHARLHLLSPSLLRPTKQATLYKP